MLLTTGELVFTTTGAVGFTSFFITGILVAVVALLFTVSTKKEFKSTF
ncbi:MAG: hypothetical protein R2801_03270 [Chitinophagales bacterium]